VAHHDYDDGQLQKISAGIHGLLLSGAKALAAQIAAGKIPAARLTECNGQYLICVGRGRDGVLGDDLVLVFERFCGGRDIDKRSRRAARNAYVATQWVAGAEATDAKASGECSK